MDQSYITIDEKIIKRFQFDMDMHLFITSHGDALCSFSTFNKLEIHVLAEILTILGYRSYPANQFFATSKIIAGLIVDLRYKLYSYLYPNDTYPTNNIPIYITEYVRENYNDK